MSVEYVTVGDVLEEVAQVALLLSNLLDNFVDATEVATAALVKVEVYVVYLLVVFLANVPLVLLDDCALAILAQRQQIYTERAVV